MQVETLYQDIILDHYKNPHGKGLREPFDAEAYHVNPTCGDEVTLRVRLVSEGDDVRIDDVSYDSVGCSISQAAASVLHDLVRGQRLEDAMRVHDEFVALMQSKGQVEPDEEVLQDGIAFAGVSKYPARIKCALLAWMAWKDATARALGSAGGDGSAAGDASVGGDQGQAPRPGEGGLADNGQAKKEGAGR